MNAPEDQNGLREALARAVGAVVMSNGDDPDPGTLSAWTPDGCPGVTDWNNLLAVADALIVGPLASLIAERDEADRRAGAAERQHACGLDVRLKMTEARRKMKLARGYDESVSFDRVWAETTAKADRAVAAEARFTTVRAALDAQSQAKAEVRASLRAAEAEITRLKEGMEALGTALKPFALGADIADADCLKCFAHLSYIDEQEIDPILPSGETPILATLGDFRRARSALATLSPKERP